MGGRLPLGWLKVIKSNVFLNEGQLLLKVWNWKLIKDRMNEGGKEKMCGRED